MGFGSIQFKSSDTFLEERFEWAKKMALSYSHHGEDKVGLWYEAALPERDSFCIRDISHQIHGATFLGLDKHSKNMLEKFILNISDKRDYCTYWEIDKDNQPTAVDYTNDTDFWYVLLANFELVVACYQQYCYTGDTELINGTAYEEFFQQTFNEYIDRWDLDGDGILEHYQSYGRRGLASYNEVVTSILHGGDMLAVQYAAYHAYSKILFIRGCTDQAVRYREKAETLQRYYLNNWYNPETESFYGAKQENGDFYPEYFEEGNFLPIYFQIFKEDDKLEKAIATVKENPVKNVEGLTYMAQTFYQYDKISEGWDFFNQLIDPDLHRNEYPEVSYSIIANYVSGMMGLNVTDYLKFTVRNNCLINATNELENIPLFNGELDLSYKSEKEIELCYNGFERPICTVTFNGSYDYCQLNGEIKELLQTKDRNGQKISQMNLILDNNCAYKIQVR